MFKYLYWNYYEPRVEIKDYVVLTDNKSWDIWNKHIKILEFSRDNDYARGNLLDYEYFSKRYKLILIESSKHIELENLIEKQKNITFLKSL